MQVKVKDMIPLDQISSIQLSEKTDGLVFTPVNEPIRIGTHETLFKWKPRHQITIDFLVKNGKDLYIQGRKQAQLHLSIRPYKDDTILECDYRELGWTPVRERTDKTYPNNRRTFDRTIVNLRENIKLEEFYNL
jgi:isocitrate/isopropylmalate dehydrogenase